MRPSDQAVVNRTVDLDHEQLLVIEDQPGARIRVLSGGVWLTEERRAQDRFATSGQDLRLEASGRAVVEAIGPTRTQIIQPACGAAVSGWRAVLRRQFSLRVLALRAAAAALSIVMSVGLPELLGRSAQHHQPAGQAHAAARVASPAAPG